ncbi:MAG: hypothetical protein ABIS50_01215 [Luteolibacter sp.]|uniref:hypothetical protein n=1 Tax=Luteolibacter sp. TaxID=1962973 RepID=UPI0032633FE6
MPPPPPPPSGNAYPDSSVENARTCLVWGWCLVGGGCLIALVPVVRVLNLLVGPPLLLAGLILAIVAISKGRPGGGVALLLFSITAAPIIMFLAPMLGLLGFGSASASPSPTTGSLPVRSEVEMRESGRK